MAEAQASQPQTQSQAAGGRGRSHGRRRGRGGRGRGQADGTARRGRDASSSQNSTSQQNQQTHSEATQSSTVPSGPRSHHDRRGGRRAGHGQGRRGLASSQAQRPSTHRAFGGHLTSTMEESADDDETQLSQALSVDAPEFVPGQPVVQRSKPAARERRPSKRPKSTAADLATRIHEDISNFNYECTICTDDVTRNSSVWSCTLCWTVIHLKCVKRWYENQKKQTDLQSSEPQQEFSWRCPGCNSKLTDEPTTYHCWCGKDINPRPATLGVPPHSCGQTCSKPRPTCPHLCSLQCHAGPCPPCDLMGPKQSCFCGKEESSKLCRETDYENGWSCQQLCGDLLPCGEHVCSRPCHSGLCGDCETPVDAKCYCGRVEKRLPCYEQDDIQSSFNPADGSWFEVSLNCGNICGRSFDCGIHKCSMVCHPQDEQAAHCPFSPDVITHCPCGKTPLLELLGHERASCEDSIPHCERPCDKILPCGHRCKAKCHTGDCGFCNETIDLSCRCGRTSSRSICHQGDIEHPLCLRTCQVNLSCGRHKCGERCCTGEKKAAERQAAKRKHRITGQLPPVEAEHICIRTCGRQLKCGSHTCQQICHRGPCASCPEAIFEEISCNCGRTVLQPPQPCGTLPPECRFDCQRRPACGHPPIQHNCHSDEIDCPKCPFLVEKICACGKEKLHSQPCHLQESHCGRACGKKLKCGLHNCKKLCHKPGECADEGTSGKRCDQVCGKSKMFCEHHCQLPCHAQTPCNESVPCTAKTTISCPCGNRKQELRCLASSSNPTPERPELKCDDECLRLERNRRLANALNIDPSTHQNDHVPYSETTLRLFKETPSWAEEQERQYRVLATTATENKLRYKPLPTNRRQFLHVLADDFGFDSISQDVEPYRYVVISKGSRFVAAPSKTIAQCIKIRESQAAEAAAAEAAYRAPSPPIIVPTEPYNGFLLTAPQFGLTVDDVRATLKDDLAAQPSLSFAIDFLPSDEILLRATAHYSAFLNPTAMEQALLIMKPQVEATVKKTSIAAGMLLCHAESSGSGISVVRRENLSRQDASGWNAVAGKAAVKKATAPMPADDTASRGSRGKVTLGRKKKIEPKKEMSWTSNLSGDAEC